VTTQTTPSQKKNLLLNPWIALGGLFLLGLLVRCWRLEWQPLWWDEGYSVYFATEPLARMFWLTAHDIHPPLYYTLLHGWIRLFGGAPAPLVLRTFSVLLGALAVPALFVLGHTLFPRRPLVAWLAALLLALSPMHLFYSQEVRMYALALLLGVLATTCFVASLGRRPVRTSLVLYWLFATLLLYSLYYGALLLLAHAISLGYLLWRRRTEPTLHLPWRSMTAAWVAIFVAYLPWLIYALPKLIPYVAQKVASDQDSPLNPLAYLTRHLNAFLAGHVIDQRDLVQWAVLVGIVGVLSLLGLLIVTTRSAKRRASGSPMRAHQTMSSISRSDDTPPHPVALLSLWLVLPILCAWLISLRSPFLPEGGERLLLIVLPFFLLLIAWGSDQLVIHSRLVGLAPFALIAIAAITGVGIYYTTARYTQEDYRSLLADISRMGRDADSLVAIFPWQVGYWRAYAPRDIVGPKTLLLNDFAVEWDDSVEEALATALAGGTLWFPEPLAFGSSLPFEMERWLAKNSANVENRWYSLTTRLTAWADLALLQPHAPAALFGNELTLMGSAIQMENIPADNAPLSISLLWDGIAMRQQSLGATLRLVDGEGRIWASRDYAPVGAFAQEPDEALPLALERLGLAIPAGTPPGEYTLHLGIVQDGDLLPVRVDGIDGALTLMELGTVTVTLPDMPPALSRLPIGEHIQRPVTVAGLSTVGATLPTTPTLAGESVNAALFVRAEEIIDDDRTLLLRLAGSESSAEWRGWSLPEYPTSQWMAGFVTAVPATIPLPGTLSTGDYALSVQWLDGTGASLGESILLGTVAVEQRRANFTPATPQHTLESPAQFGTHALLHGYTLNRIGSILHLALEWEVLQPILPPHEIFVHLDDDSATPPTIAQQDGPPVTASGRAPTGSWQVGESLTTIHQIAIPSSGIPAGTLLRVGLFEPQSGMRLPLSIDNAPAGDAFTIPIIGGQ